MTGVRRHRDAQTRSREHTQPARSARRQLVRVLDDLPPARDTWLCERVADRFDEQASMTSDANLSRELAEARRRLAELEAADAERRQPETVQSALYRIAELASTAQDMQDFYRAVHGIVGELMNANNFYIALYDDERKLISWPYLVDELGHDLPDPNQWDEFGSGHARGDRAAHPQPRPAAPRPAGHRAAAGGAGRARLVTPRTHRQRRLGHLGRGRVRRVGPRRELGSASPSCKCS